MCWYTDDNGKRPQYERQLGVDDGSDIRRYGGKRDNDGRVLEGTGKCARSTAASTCSTTRSTQTTGEHQIDNSRQSPQSPDKAETGGRNEIQGQALNPREDEWAIQTKACKYEDDLTRGGGPLARIREEYGDQPIISKLPDASIRDADGNEHPIPVLITGRTEPIIIPLERPQQFCMPPRGYAQSFNEPGRYDLQRFKFEPKPRL